MSGAGAGIAVAVVAGVGLWPWWLAPRVTDRARRIARTGAPASEPTGRCDVTVLLALLAVASSAGGSVPRVLEGVGVAVGGPDGTRLRSAAAALGLGATWAQAWDGCDGAPRLVADALAPTWERGAAPGPALRAAGDQVRRDRRERAARAAGRLGVRLVLPLGLCYLPAFVVVGIVPVLVSYGAGALR